MTKKPQTQAEAIKAINRLPVANTTNHHQEKRMVL